MIKQHIDNAWEFVFGKMFSPKTKIFYDYRSSEDADGAFRHLPTRDEVERSYPNPCGWFAGMEDSDINGGDMLRAITLRYALTGDGEMKRYAYDVYEGLLANATVSEQVGFLARGRLLSDGKTHYINSSRDQYTHWIDGMLCFYHSPLSSEEQRQEIQRGLVGFAEKAEHDVTEENRFCLLTSDERPALVCEMKGERTQSHESLRLPMIYMGAYAVTGDEHWYRLYEQEREWALPLAEAIDPEKVHAHPEFAPCFLLQMQLSIRVLYDYERDESYKARYEALMDRVADISEYYVERIGERLHEMEMPRTVPAWSECPPEFRSDLPNNYGFSVCMPDVYTAAMGRRGLWKFRDVQEAIVTQALCPRRAVKEDQKKVFYRFVERFTFDRCFSAFVPIVTILAYWLLEEKE